MATISSRAPAGRDIPRLWGGVEGSGLDLLGSGPGPVSGVEAGTIGPGAIGEGGSTVSPGTGPSLDLTVCREAGPTTIRESQPGGNDRPPLASAPSPRESGGSKPPGPRRKRGQPLHLELLLGGPGYPGSGRRRHRPVSEHPGRVLFRWDRRPEARLRTCVRRLPRTTAPWNCLHYRAKRCHLGPPGTAADMCPPPTRGSCHHHQLLYCCCYHYRPRPERHQLDVVEQDDVQCL